MRKRLLPDGVNYDETKVLAYTLPDPLRLAHVDIGTRPEEWRKNRRLEIMRLFQDFVYGRSPKAPKTVQFHQTSNDPHALAGAATRKEITLLLTGQPDGPHMHLILYIPNHVPKPVPAFLGLNFKGNHTIHPDSGISLIKQWQQPNRNAPPVNVRPSEETRGAKANRWPVEKILQRGYALVTAYYVDLEQDFQGGGHYRIRAAFCIRSKPKENSVPARDMTASDGKA